MSDLSNVKPGDVMARFQYGSVSLLKVDRVTDTQIICGLARFKRSNGHMVGGDRGSASISAQPHMITRGRKSALEAALRQPIPLTLDGIAKARALLDRAEAFIKEHGG